MINVFYRTRLIFKISTYIQKNRSKLLEDLVAYTKDSVRYKRRLRMLIQLAEYEQNILKKIRDFETHNVDDLNQSVLGDLIVEVDSIVDKSS